MKTKTKNIFKSALSLTLALIMVLGVAPLSELAGADWAGLFAPKAEAATSGIYTYEIANGKATITDCDASASGAITIPSTLGGYPVTRIGNFSFESCDSLTSVTIPNSVTTIGDRAFAFCDSLTSVTIPNSVTTIGNFAFGYCDSLTSVTIPNSVTSIGNFAFYSCKSLTNITVDANNKYYLSADGVLFNKNKTALIQYPIGNTRTSYTIPNSVTSIGDDAFRGCYSLTSVTIPNSVTSIGDHPFASCTSLTSITVDANNKYYSSADGVLFNKDKTELIQYPIGNARTSYTIPNSVTSIGDWAFASCDSLTSVTIPNSVTSIGDDAFYSCDSLTSVTIPNSVTSIGHYAFAYCHSLTSVTIGNSVTSIGHCAFLDCSSLTSVTIPNSVTSIGNHAFSSCDSLTSVTIGNSVTSIGDYAFAYCYSLTSVTIPNSVTSIGDDAFLDCISLTSVTIPNSVTSIGDDAFRGCCSLTSVTIGNSVTSIGDYAFGSCSSLTSVTVDANNKYYSSADGVLFNKDKTELIQYPTGNTRTSYTIPNSVTSIGRAAFIDCDGLTSVTIPNSVTSIGDDAFEYCDSLTSVTIPNNVTSIGNYAFYKCDSLTDVYYTGTEEEWKSISIGSYNEPLLNATIHYNSSSTDDKSFNQPVYIADIWSGSRNEKTPEHESLQWYYNDYTPITKSIVDELEKNNKFKNAVNTWNGVKMITSPSSGTKTELNKEQQCEVLIFDVIRDILGSTDYSDIISTSSAEDLVNWTKSLNGAAKSIYDAEGIENFEDFYNKYGKKLDGKKKTKALVEKAYELHQEDVGAVSALDDVLKYVDLALDVVDSGEKFINSFVNCLMAARMSESLKSVLREMYAQPGISSEMKTALSEIKTACESQENALTKVASDFVTVNGVKVFGKLADEIWGEMISAVPGVGTLYKMIEIGTDIGEGVSNMLFSTGSTIDNYYLAKSTVELVNIAKKTSLSLQSKFLSNKNKNTANPYIDSVRFYVSALSVDAESGRKFCDTACNDGLINGVSNWLNGGNAKYDEIERSTESIKKSNKQFISFMSISWIFADNYLKKDYPAIYDIMVKNILTNPDYSSTITQVKIGFDGKAVVYFNVPSYVSGFKAVSGVEIYYKKNNGSYSLLSSTNPYSKYVSHNITLSNTDTYSYKVRAYTTLSSGQKAYSDFSNEFTVVANPAETPQIQCSVGATGVNIIIKDELVSSGFSSSQSGAITSVEIYRRRQGESSGTRIKTIPVDFGRPHLYTDTNPGTSKCYYSARTVITYNGKTYYSKYSPEMSAIMLNDVPQNTKININIKPGRSLPQTRTMTVDETSDCLSVELNWNKIDGVTEYEICRKLSCGTSYVSVGTVNGETTSFVDTTVSEAGTYDYIVRFYRNMNGEKVLCGESQSASVLIERVANQTETVTIKNGQTTNLSINSGNLSDGSTVSWSTSSDCVTLTPSEDGTSCGVKAVSEGNATVTVTITHKDGSTVSDTFDVEAKRKGVLATIFDIILSPFRLIISLFKLIIGLFK